MTLLTFNSKYVITSANAVTTTSSSLVDDTEASQTFSLSATEVVLVIYAANSVYGSTEPALGIQNAISVDGTDYAKSYDSEGTSGYPVRNCTSWIGSLASGSHTIKGRFASMSNGSTATINNRVLLIYIFDGTEFQYVDSTTTATTTSNSFVDDTPSSVTFTPSGSCVLLALYNASASGATEDIGGKHVGISIAAADYAQAEKTPGNSDQADSIFTVHCLSRTAVSTVVKGRFANNRASSVTVSIHRRQLGVLLINNTVPFDIVTSTTLVDTTSNSLVDDTQASISRTPSAMSELLVIAMGTKRHNQAGCTSGMCYGIEVDTNDRTKACGCPIQGGSGWGDSAATAWAEQVTAVAHTVKGRHSNNYDSEDSYISARQVVALWFAATVTNVSLTDSGSGSDTLASLSATISPTDSGSGVEASVPIAFTLSDMGSGTESSLSLQGSFTATDSGSGSDTLVNLTVTFTVSDANSATNEVVSTSSTLTISESGNASDSWAAGIAFTVTEAAAGSDAATSAVSITFSDSSSGVDAAGLSGTISISETSTGADVVVALTGSFAVTDWGAGVDVPSPVVYITAFEETLGAEFAWRLKGSTLVDSFTLPHVLSITINDEADMSTRLVQGGSLPKQRMLGKPGRIVDIVGWTDNQDDIDSMEALTDGTVRTFIHPSGDSFAVLVTDFQPESKADEYGRRSYTLTLKETR